MKIPGKCTGSKYLSLKFGEWRKRYLGSHDLVHEKLKLCEAENESKF